MTKDDIKKLKAELKAEIYAELAEMLDKQKTGEAVIGRTSDGDDQYGESVSQTMLLLADRLRELAYDAKESTHD